MNNTHTLATLNQQVRRDLELLRLPPAQWTAETAAPDGSILLDVLIIGAGMFGLAAAGSLLLKGVSNIKLLDAAGRGNEGPWVTVARMTTLRSPKELPGAPFGLPSLTFRAWYEARFGTAEWEVLYKIPNATWQNYLGWLRDVLSLPVQNDCVVVDLRPAADHVAAVTSDGRVFYAKRVVIATGRAGAGGFRKPTGISADLWPDLAAHTGEPIDFSALKGKAIALVGAGASAWDNAATALETGAARVDMYCRRKALPQLNKGRANANPGFFEGWGALPPADKWALAVYLERMQPAPPHETILRTLALDGFHIHFGAPIRSAQRLGGQVLVTLQSATEHAFDFLILGTGFRVDLASESMFCRFADRILRWRDAYRAPTTLTSPNLGTMPFLGSGFELRDRDGRDRSDLQRIHIFNVAAYLSFGTLTLDIPSLSIAGNRLASHLCQRLFQQDFDDISNRLKAWEDEHELQPTPLYAPDFVNRID